MKTLLLVVFLTGCSNAQWDSIGRGLQAAGGGLDEGVYNQQHGLPPPSPQKQLDSACWMNCIDVYSPPFCKSKCSY